MAEDTKSTAAQVSEIFPPHDNRKMVETMARTISMALSDETRNQIESIEIEFYKIRIIPKN